MPGPWEGPWGESWGWGTITASERLFLRPLLTQDPGGHFTTIFAVIAQDINSCKNVTTSEVQGKLFNTFANTLFDKVLSSVAKSRAIDRVSLPNIVHTFESNVIPKISAQVSLYRGILEGLSSLTRTGNCRFEVGECGIDIKADLGAGPLNSSFVGLVRVMGFGQAVTVDVNVRDLRILLGLAQ
ncbi:hypothetical protein HPB47_019353 [Ixodes persulcatus]|uniref:Uncharacterized protein n=1 Tax=Ixodes persulcatus TaxID=34615 RepID=A0AC60QKZ2_IXOPE|nr:hypothetical protein HPB47_019353 [Ixodes persulcatus]